MTKALHTGMFMQQVPIMLLFIELSRDCAYKNIMMDASALFPRGFHPVIQCSLPDVSAEAPVLSRAVMHINYYFIDFGISSYFRPDSFSRLVVGSSGLDQEPPELSRIVPYDPFKLDVFLIGNLIRRHFCDVCTSRHTSSRANSQNPCEQKYSNLPMLEPLMKEMVHPDPARRPTAAEAYQKYTAIRKSVSPISQYWSLQPRDSYLLVKVVRHVYSLVSA